MAFVPEDRHRDALILEFSLVENVALRGSGVRRGRMAWHALHERTRALISRAGLAAIATGYHALAAGGGEKIEYGWVEVKPHALVREDTPNG